MTLVEVQIKSKSGLYKQIVVDFSTLAPAPPTPGGGRASTYKSFELIHILRPEPKKKSWQIVRAFESVTAPLTQPLVSRPLLMAIFTRSVD